MTVSEIYGNTMVALSVILATGAIAGTALLTYTLVYFLYQCFLAFKEDLTAKSSGDPTGNLWKR